jgi:hypothetical protein
MNCDRSEERKGEGEYDKGFFHEAQFEGSGSVSEQRSETCSVFRTEPNHHGI